MIKKVFSHYNVDFPVTEKLRATFKSKLWRMGRALAKGGGNQRAKLLEKWKGGDDWQVEIDEIEYNKKLVGMKRKAESCLLGEQKKRAKVEAELQEQKKKVRSLETCMKELLKQAKGSQRTL